MLVLAIDTSTRAGSVALVRDRQILAEVSAGEDLPHSSGLFRDLELLRSKADFRMSEIDVFAVAAGPGSFTGLRVGLTAVKGWAEVHRKSIAAISGLEAIAAQASTKEEMVHPFLDARQGHVFGATYRQRAADSTTFELIGTEAILTVAEFIAQVKVHCGARPAVLVSPSPDVLPRDLVKSALSETRIEQVSASLAPAIGKLAFDRVERGDLVDSLGLDANYLRRSDAEALWRDA